MIAYLTDHSSERLKERVGLPKRAHRRMAKLAMKRGFSPAAASGEFRFWLDSEAFYGDTEEDRRNVMLRVHGYKLYVFRRRRHTRSRNAYALLITVLNIPKKLWKAVDSARLSSEPS